VAETPFGRSGRGKTVRRWSDNNYCDYYQQHVGREAYQGLADSIDLDTALKNHNNHCEAPADRSIVVNDRPTSDDADPRVVVGVLWLMVFVVGSQALLVAPVIPRIAEQLDADPSGLGVLVTAYAVAVGVVSLFSGPVSDHVGRRRMLLAGTAMLTVTLGAHFFAASVTSLLAVRALAGVAGGVLNGAAVAYVGDHFRPERRGWANGWVFSGFAAGQIAGIPLGAVAADRLGFRWPFVGFAVLSAVTYLLVFRYLPQHSGTTATGRLTVRSALAGYVELLSRRDVLAAATVFPIMFGGNALFTTFLPTWLELELGMTAGAVGFLFLVGGVANVLIGPRAGRLSDRVGRKRVIVAASLGLAGVMAATPTIALAVGVPAVYVLFAVVMGLFATRASPLQTLLTELVPGHRRGTLMSLTVGVGQVGSGVGGAVAGRAYADVGYEGSALAGGLAMLVIAGLVAAFLPETVPGLGRATGVDATAAVEEREAVLAAEAARDRTKAKAQVQNEARDVGSVTAGKDGTTPDPPVDLHRGHGADHLVGPHVECGYAEADQKGDH
jgi:predicted MFS family arabinose efflux permease